MCIEKQMGFCRLCVRRLVLWFLLFRSWSFFSPLQVQGLWENIPIKSRCVRNRSCGDLVLGVV